MGAVGDGWSGALGSIAWNNCVNEPADGDAGSTFGSLAAAAGMKGD